MGIEPTSEAWEASILPLYDARSFRLPRLYLIPPLREKLRARVLQKLAVTSSPALPMSDFQPRFNLVGAVERNPSLPASPNDYRQCSGAEALGTPSSASSNNPRGGKIAARLVAP
jgi:hypothetical protein